MKQLALLLLSASLACGDDGGASADAMTATGDAAIEPGACGIELLTPGVTPTEVAVVFSNPDGSLLADTSLDDAAAASFDGCVVGTMISIFLEAPGGQRTTLTVGGVVPGQTAVVGVADVAPPADPGSTLEVTMSETGDPPAATAYGLSAGPLCTDSDASVATTLTTAIGPACLGGSATTVDALVRARNAGGDTLAYDFATDVEVVDGGTTAVSLDGWEAASTMAFELSNIPAQLTDITYTLTQKRDGITYASRSPPSEPLSGDDFSDSLPALPAGFIDRVEYTATLQAGSQRYILIGLGSAATDVTIDAGSTVLPRVSSLVSLADASRPAIEIFPDQPIDGADVVSARLLGPDKVWGVMVPASSFPGEIRFPAVPPALDAYIPGLDIAIQAAGFARFEGLDYADLVSDGRFTPGNVTSANLGEVLTTGESASITSRIGAL